MAKNLIVTYILWFFGGFFGLHHFYLGRDRHAFVWWVTFGGFTLGWIRDLWRIPSYVSEANNDVEGYPEREHWPEFSPHRFFGGIVMGCIFGYLILCGMPEELIDSNLWQKLQLFLLSPLAVAIGIHLVGNIGEQCGSLKWALIGSYLGVPFTILTDYKAIGYMALISAFLFNWKSKTWKSAKIRHQPLAKRLMILSGSGAIYTCLILSMLYYNASITYYDGKQLVEVKLREAVENFFKSPAWLKFREHWTTISKFAEIHGWSHVFNEILRSFDPAGVQNSLQVLELPENATEKEITNQYRKLVKLWHPDKFRDEDSKKTAHENFLKIQNAYEVLMKHKKSDKVEF